MVLKVTIHLVYPSMQLNFDHWAQKCWCSTYSTTLSILRASQNWDTLINGLTKWKDLSLFLTKFEKRFPIPGRLRSYDEKLWCHLTENWYQLGLWLVIIFKSCMHQYDHLLSLILGLGCIHHLLLLNRLLLWVCIICMVCFISYSAFLCCRLNGYVFHGMMFTLWKYISFMLHNFL